MDTARGCRLVLLVAGLVALVGCTTNMENVAKILAERPPSTCQLPVEGQLVPFTGPVCDQAAGEYIRSLRFSACSDFSATGEQTCLLAVALTSDDGDKTADDTQLLIASMQEDGRNTRFWGGKILDVGMFGVDRYYDHKSSESFNDFLSDLANRSSVMNITQSNDGAGTEGGGRGGDGDLFVLTGDNAQTINRSEGSAISDGRNPVFMGINRPDSSFETSNNNQNNAPGAENNNSPAVSTSDDDGGQSIVPDLF